MTLTDAAKTIAAAAVKGALPYENTLSCLKTLQDMQNPTVLAVGKAAVPMAKAAAFVFGDRIKNGLLLTKYGHAYPSDGSAPDLPPGFRVLEAGHPVSDDNSVLAANEALSLCRQLKEDDTLLFLLSGGGSALMEASRVPALLQRSITEKLLKRGADVSELNAVRRGLSRVKGGRLAAAAYPARVVTLALSDVLGNDPAVIASGPTVPAKPDRRALDRIVARYLFDVPGEILSLLYDAEELEINDGGYHIVGDVGTLVAAAKKEAEALGFTPHIVTTNLVGEARDEAVRILDAIPNEPGRHAYLYAGETTVTVTGTGKGGRNQEMALAAAIHMKHTKNTVFLSVGSDGTDGPTDAAGGVATGETYDKIKAAGVDPEAYLRNNDAYNALLSAGALLFTGPTGTNVNDLTMVLTEQNQI